MTESFLFCNAQELSSGFRFLVPPAKSKLELLQAYNDGLMFPYFGFNWDALEDALRDLSWIDEKELWIYHNSLPKLSDLDLQIYIRILANLSREWLDDVKHDFCVAFSPTLKREVNKYIYGLR